MANDDDGEITQNVCKVYDVDDAFTSLVQALLAALALGSLYIKRMNESPRRKFNTWFLDVFKQGLGATYAHCLNMVIAAVIADNVRGDNVLEDQCAWYAINFLIDTTLGLFLSVLFLKLLSNLAEKRGWDSLMNSGVYVGPEAMLHWLNQLLAWIFILTVVKIILVFVLWAFSPILAVIGDFLFKPMQSNIRFELLFVMIFFPGFLNMFYFWIADGYLKAGAEHDGAHEDDGRDSSLSEHYAYQGEVIASEKRTDLDSFSSQNTPVSNRGALPSTQPVAQNSDGNKIEMV